jgi:hypothetical protein
MAKKATKGDGDSVAGYFKEVFKENLKLLKTRSNDEVLKRWLADHPGHKEVPTRIKANLANVKSVLRKQIRKKGGRKKLQAAEMAADHGKAPPSVPAKVLETLEFQIDNCLTEVRGLKQDIALANVISSLRRARNEIVWMLGE